MATTLDQAHQIIKLHDALKSFKERLAAIDRVRNDGVSVSVEFKVGTKNFNEEIGLKFSESFRGRPTPDIAAIILARLSDETASKIRKIERDLIAIGGQP